MGFPKMLIRKGSAVKWEGELYDTLIVNDADEMADAKKDGWSLATDIHGKGEEAPRRGRQRKATNE